MGNPIVAYEFLNAHLPKNVLDSLDMKTLQLEKESFIEPDLSSSFSDVVFSAKFGNNQDGYIFILLEHQSTSD